MQLTRAGRWSLVALVVVVALIVAIWPRDTDDPASAVDGARPTAAPVDRRAQDTPEALAPLRAAAALEGCPAPAGNGAGPLAGLRFECLGDGSSVDLAAALAGRPALVNLWAWWCGPCAEELPYLQEYAQRAGDAVAVVTVHTDPNEANALSRLAEYAVQLPGVQDGSARAQAAVQSPPVLPVTVLLRPDGSVAKVLPQPFRSADEVAAAVEEHLGVKV
ncbi:TlpA disulfide reductase family protein [Rhodococcus sp. GXMU-t2271]|uniref:TlpA disulfide reductase family protein n=1 Tax=Rhodococcus indonesiensis TaxID=3055869 RepID=A0ABT7RHT1_9NOCA|nr:TlpA disulfide reductase family protein [Rhodococcus indonesiensis]MDM7487188.1 TlpA disulfide reductase family protein [Rhodococcus indonesiensis]